MDDDFEVEAEVVAPMVAASSSKRGAPADPEATRSSKRTAKLPCLVLDCEAVRSSQCRFCAMHKRSEDAMKYQAKAQGQEAEQMMAQVLADDEKAAHEVAMFSKINPPDKKYARKKLIQWASYLQKQYRKTSTKESSGEVPMTMQAFKCHCENVLGLTEQEWKGWWAELLADKTVQRDSEGFRGRLQLWVSMGKRRDVASETGIVHELQEGSNQIKNCSDHDRQVLVDHLKRQTLSVNEELAQLQAPLPLSAGGRGGESCTKSEEKRACSDVEGEPQKKKLRKKC